MRPKFVLTLQMIYIIFSVLISIHVVLGTELSISSSHGTVYKWNDEKKNILGAGAYGRVFKGTKIINGTVIGPVAMKFGNPKLLESVIREEFEREKSNYDELAGLSGIPKFHDLLESKKYNSILITELLGRNLYTIRNGRKFSVKTTMMIGLQMLNIIEAMHEKKIIHHDLKPDNIAVGYENPSKIYILDFGFSGLYWEENAHIEPSDDDTGPSYGHRNYLSIYGHTHWKLSRRDDIESLAYILIEFLRGKLPWLNKTRKYDLKTTPNIEAIVGTECTKTLSEFLLYARKLQFIQKPDYNKLRKLLEDELHGRGYSIDNRFDWMDVKWNIPSSDSEVPTGAGCGCTIQ